jgi:hypothetical protein
MLGEPPSLLFPSWMDARGLNERAQYNAVYESAYVFDMT